MVRVATWLTHLEFDWESPVWRHWLQQLGSRHSVIRYDERGCGLSDRTAGEVSLDAWVGDLEAVVAAADLDRFVLLGISQGAAIAIVYAALHPERVSHLVLYGGYARGRRVRSAGEGAQEEALISAIRAGWDDPTPTFRRVFSMLFLPSGSAEEMAWYDDLLRHSATAEMAARLYEARGSVNVMEFTSRVEAKTLVVHARHDRVVPAEEGRLLASLIPGAEFTLLESANHILLADEPAWPAFLSRLDAFLGTKERIDPHVADLSVRELEVLELVAEGLTNEAIAERLVLSVRTVERHLSNLYAKLGVSGKAGRAAAAASFSALRAARQPR